jgi:DNA-binding protein H-NS
MSRLEELRKQQEKIAAEIAAEVEKDRAVMVQKVREVIKDYGITLSEVKNVLTMRKPRAKTAAKASKASSGAPKKRGRPRKNA